MPGSTRWVPATVICWMTRAGAAGCAGGGGLLIVGSGAFGIQRCSPVFGAGAQLRGRRGRKQRQSTTSRKSRAEPLYDWRWSAFRRPALVLKARNTNKGGGRSFRKDSAEPGRSKWSGAPTPGPIPAQAEIRRPGPAHPAAAPKQLRMHSTEDARRRAAEWEKGWPAQCLRKVQPPAEAAP